MRRLPGEHAPNCKNRSSKHLTWLTKMRPAVRSMNGENLKRMADNGNREAMGELTRREKKNKKTPANSQKSE